MGFSRGPQLITEGLALVLDATSERSWTPGASTWYDLSGNANHATVYGAPATQDSGTNLRSIYLDGTNDYFEVNSNETSLSFKNGQTVGILFYTTYTSGRRNLWNQAYGGYGTWTHEQGDNINCYYGTNGGNGNPYTSTNSGDTPQGQWNYMVNTRDPSNIRWYRNGTLVNTTGTAYVMSSVNTTASITIGVGYTGVYWLGNIVFVHAYNRGLTPDEIYQNYNIIKGRFS
jgi:hypothetical protein